MAQIIGARHGFNDGDVDYQSYGSGKVSVTLSGTNKTSITASGETIELAVVKLLERLY